MKSRSKNNKSKNNNQNNSSDNDIFKEKTKLTVKEILLNLVDFTADFAKCFERRRGDFEIVDIYKNWRDIDRDNYYQQMWKLEKRGYIKKYLEGKKSNFQLTEKGKQKALKYIFSDLKIKTPKTWDKKWRMVIFDIPEEKKSLREAVRLKLKQFGFLQLQKSVWVYPFDCQEIIYTLKYIYSLGKNVQYILAETIETEIDLVDYFYEQELLNRKIKLMR